MDVLIKSAPSNQTELDLFKNDWSYEIPIPNTVTGKAPIPMLPASVSLARESFGPLDGFRVLELGPNECEITIGLSKEKVKKIVSIEARSRKFLKCLVVKNILNMKNVRFLLGDFVEYLRSQNERFDLCLACGVLYHMTDPVELIEMICKHCDRVVVASHYVNDNLIHYDKNKDTTNLGTANWNIIEKEGREFEYKGLKVKYFRNYYPDAVETNHDIYGHGGVEHYGNMMEINDIIRTFGYFEFEVVGEIVDHPDGPRGPHVLFAAKQKGVPLTLRKNRHLKIRRNIKRFLKSTLSRGSKHRIGG